MSTRPTRKCPWRTTEIFIYVRPNGIATRGGRVGFGYFDEKGDVVAFVKTNRPTTSRPEMGTVHRLELSWSSVPIDGPVSPSAMGSTATVFKGNISNVFGSGEHITPQPTLGTQPIAKWRSSSSFVRTGGQRQPTSEGVGTLPCAIKKFGEGGVVKLNLKELRRIEKELKLNFRCDHLNLNVAPLIGMIRTEGVLCAVMPLAPRNLDEHFDRENRVLLRAVLGVRARRDGGHVRRLGDRHRRWQLLRQGGNRASFQHAGFRLPEEATVCEARRAYGCCA